MACYHPGDFSHSANLAFQEHPKYILRGHISPNISSFGHFGRTRPLWVTLSLSYDLPVIMSNYCSCHARSKFRNLSTTKPKQGLKHIATCVRAMQAAARICKLFSSFKILRERAAGGGTGPRPVTFAGATSSTGSAPRHKPALTLVFTTDNRV